MWVIELYVRNGWVTTARVRYLSKGGATSCVIMYAPSIPMVAVLVSGRFFPRTIPRHVHVPRRNFIDEKSGSSRGTGVCAGAGEGAALDGATPALSSNAMQARGTNRVCLTLFPFRNPGQWRCITMREGP